MRIVELHVHNVKRIRAVRHRPPPGARVVQVRGPNGAGKSSLLDSICYALGGGKLICHEPLRSGERVGQVRVDLGDVTVTRTWERHPHTGEVSSELEVRSAAGIKLKRPQQALDTLLGALSFDPLGFLREPAKRQLQLVRELVGLDFAELDAQRHTAFEDRTALGRDLRRLDGELAGMRLHPSAPDEPVDLGALVAQIEAALASSNAAERARQSLASAEQAHRALEASLERLAQERAALEQRVELLRAQEREHAQSVVAGRQQLEEIGARAQALAAAVTDPAPLRRALAEAEATNQRVRENAARRQVAERSRELSAKVDQLSERITSIDREKERLAAAASFPVPGLGFRPDGLTLNGLPFEQSSQAEMIRVSVAMGGALNPALRVLLVRDGSLCDESTLALLEQIAEEQDLQIWLERVAEPGESPEGGAGDVLYIRDGEAA